jgi:nicotinate-nucleotide pyrophosphorylase (carboxylating)
MNDLDQLYVEQVVRSALAEDIGSGDITTLATIPQDHESTAVMLAKQEGIVAGLEVAATVFRLLDKNIVFRPELQDGARVSDGVLLATVSGATRAILTAERTALNFVQRMSGIATLTNRYIALVAHTGARILDTRKTSPGLRRLEKYAVSMGGGTNHRFGLDDGILIKDNHVAVAGGVAAAIRAAKSNAPHTLRIEVEVDDLNQLREAIDAGADVVLLDNMPLEIIRKAVELTQRRVLLEASGGITLENIADVAETGVDMISIGALTHSAPALDISLDITTALR